MMKVSCRKETESSLFEGSKKHQSGKEKESSLFEGSKK